MARPSGERQPRIGNGSDIVVFHGTATLGHFHADLVFRQDCSCLLLLVSRLKLALVLQHLFNHEISFPLSGLEKPLTTSSIDPDPIRRLLLTVSRAATLLLPIPPPMDCLAMPLDPGCSLTITNVCTTWTTSVFPLTLICIVENGQIRDRCNGATRVFYFLGYMGDVVHLANLSIILAPEENIRVA